MQTTPTYFIVAVKDHDNSNRIEEVRAVRGKQIGQQEPSEHPRQAVVEAIHNGSTVETATRNDSGEWEPGERVDAYQLNGEWFIRNRRR